MPEGTTSDELTKQAIEAAREAMAQYAEAKLYRFAREAARALEMGAKAALAKISPILIADPKFIDSQLHLAGHPVGATRGARRIRTISCREALERMTRLIPTLRPLDVEPLISVRDGSTHYLEEGEGLESLVIPFLGTFLLLQQHLELSDDDVFGSDAELVSFVREKHTKEVDRKVVAKRARARHAFKARFSNLDAKDRKVALAAIAARITLDGYNEQAIPCPACDSVGVISGQHQLERWEADIDEHGGGNAYPVVTLFAHQFKCPVCGLHLEGDDELAAAGLETALDVENVDPEDFYDEDDYGDDWDGDDEEEDP
jgi:hypothetical protein